VVQSQYFEFFKTDLALRSDIYLDKNWTEEEFSQGMPGARRDRLSLCYRQYINYIDTHY